MKVLIHHHTLAYVDENGIWIQSFIGSWVTELAKHVQQIGILLHTTSLKNEKLDYCVTAPNIKLESLGENRGLKDRCSRLSHIKSKCESLDTYSHLIVRGVTPRQLLVINSSPIKKKFFLFVGCVNDSQKLKIKNFQDIISFSYKKYRNYELKQISKQALVAANSPITVNELMTKLNISSIFIPTNTISNRDFKKIKREKQNVARILFVGRVTQEKGIEELINAVQILNQKYKRKFILDVVGPYSVDYIAEIKNISRLGFENINFHGFVSFGDTLLDFYDKSDVYILPSYHEGFPHTIWEAAARQLPIICTPVGGIPGLINERMVTFIDKGSVNSIIFALERVLLAYNEEIDGKKQTIWEIAKNNSVEESTKKLIHWLRL